MQGNVKSKAGIFPIKEPGNQYQMRRTGYRQKFPQTLNQTQYYGL
jgi:hypothetical protein